MRYWKPDDIFDVCCPFCDAEIEFWKDEPMRMCRGCGMEVRNPRIDLGCAKWCKSAAECLGVNAEEHAAAAPIIDRVRARLQRTLEDNPEARQNAEDVHAIADTLLAAEGGDPCVIKTAALLAGAFWLDPQSDASENTNAILNGIDLAPDRAATIRSLLQALPLSAPVNSPELAVVQDAVTITRWRHAGTETGQKPTAEEITAAIHTNSAKILARHSTLQHAHFAGRQEKNGPVPK
jgi:hypothetical protein